MAIDKILPTIADIPAEDLALLNKALSELVELARLYFPEQLRNINDTNLRVSLLKLMEFGFFNLELDGDKYYWLIYEKSSKKWIRLTTEKLIK